MRIFYRKRQRKLGLAFIEAISNRMRQLEEQHHQPQSIRIWAGAMKGVVSYDDNNDLYVNPRDWENVTTSVKDWPESAPKDTPIEGLWGLPVVYDDNSVRS